MWDYKEEYKEYFVGDKVKYWQSNHNGEMAYGIVIAKIDLPGYAFPHYIIEYPTSIEPVLAIRSGHILEMRKA